MRQTQLARLVRSIIDAHLARHPPRAFRPGRVTAVQTGPNRLVVNGRPMPYSDSIGTPAVGDRVVFLTGPDPVVVARLA